MSGELRAAIHATAHNNYSSSYSVESNNENEQNLFNRNTARNVHYYEKIFLTVLFIIFVTGTFIGVYLLLDEGHEWRTSTVHYVTSRELWKAHVPTSTIPELQLPAQRVLFLKTNNSNSCDSKSQCAKLVKELQLKHMIQRNEPDILYNFVVSEDGSIFEGRGWKFQTTFSSNSFSDTVTIAFLGTNHTKALTQKQTESLKLFISDAIVEGKLEHCLNIDIWGGNVFLIDMVRNIQNSLLTCKKV